MMEATEQPETPHVGTPRDYSEHVYRFYLELADRSHTTRRLIEKFLPQHHAAHIVDLDDGFEFEMPIQCAPNLIRHLISKNIAIYQLVRLAKTRGHWREQSA
jgi:hypothetical protein